MSGWYKPVRRNLHLDTPWADVQHVLNSAMKIGAVTKPADQKDILDLLCLLCRVMDLIQDQSEYFANNGVEDLFHLIKCKLKAVMFDTRPWADPAHWDVASLLTTEFILRYPFKMLHGCFQDIRV